LISRNWSGVSHELLLRRVVFYCVNWVLVFKPYLSVQMGPLVQLLSKNITGLKVQPNDITNFDIMTTGYKTS
jgi:hypothetical protein